MLVPTHPESTGDPRTLRWVIPDGQLRVMGRVTRAPALFQELLDTGVLEEAVASPSAVETTLGAGRSWREEGQRVRAALMDALALPQRWQVDNGGGELLDDDAVLALAARDVAEVRLGKLLSSHGGRFDVVGVHEGVVDVRLAGECAECTAAVITMKARFQHLVAARCPWLREVRRVG